MRLLADSEGPDQTVRMRRLIWAFAVHISQKIRFCMAWSISGIILQEYPSFHITYVQCIVYK